MCDFISWGCMANSMSSKGLKRGQLIWLTDDMVEAKMQSIRDNWTNASSEPTWQHWEDWVGHSGLARYYDIPEAAFEHHESTRCIPLRIAKDVNSGKMHRLALAYDEGNENGAVTWRFKERGELCGMRYRPIKHWYEADCQLEYPHPFLDDVLRELKHCCKMLLDEVYNPEDIESLKLIYTDIEKVVKTGDYPAIHRRDQPLYYLVDRALVWEDYKVPYSDRIDAWRNDYRTIINLHELLEKRGRDRLTTTLTDEELTLW